MADSVAREVNRLAEENGFPFSFKTDEQVYSFIGINTDEYGNPAPEANRLLDESTRRNMARLITEYKRAAWGDEVPQDGEAPPLPPARVQSARNVIVKTALGLLGAYYALSMLNQEEPPPRTYQDAIHDFFLQFKEPDEPRTFEDSIYNLYGRMMGTDEDQPLQHMWWASNISAKAGAKPNQAKPKDKSVAASTDESGYVFQ